MTAEEHANVWREIAKYWGRVRSHDADLLFRFSNGVTLAYEEAAKAEKG